MLRALLPAAFALALLTGDAHAADTPVDRPARATTLAARDRVLAYSAFDAASNAFRLRVQVGSGPPRDLGVAPRSVPFDVDVGRVTTRDRSHRDVLVFSRCAREPGPASGIGPFLAFRTARGCSLRLATLDGREQRIAHAGEGALPAVSGSTLAYARFRPDGTPRIILRRLDRPGRPLRVLGGPPTRDGSPGPVGLDVFADRVAVTWRFSARSEGDDSLLFVAGTRGAGRRNVRRVAGGGMSGHAIVGATWAGPRSLQWAETCAGVEGGCRGRTLFGQWTPDRPVRTAPAPRDLVAFTTSDRAAWVLRGCADDVTPCTLARRFPPPLVPPVP